MQELEQELKQLLIEVLNLEDVSVEQIDSEAPLFGEGLGLDSIDALELGVAIRKKYDVQMDADSEVTREHFASIANLARFISVEPWSRLASCRASRSSRELQRELCYAVRAQARASHAEIASVRRPGPRQHRRRRSRRAPAGADEEAHQARAVQSRSHRRRRRRCRRADAARVARRRRYALRLGGDRVARAPVAASVSRVVVAFSRCTRYSSTSASAASASSAVARRARSSLCLLRLLVLAFASGRPRSAAAHDSLCAPAACCSPAVSFVLESAEAMLYYPVLVNAALLRRVRGEPRESAQRHRAHRAPARTRAAAGAVVLHASRHDRVDGVLRRQRRHRALHGGAGRRLRPGRSTTA